MQYFSFDSQNSRPASAAMIEPVGGHGGMHYYDFELCRGLMSAGCKVSLYTCDETPDPAIPGLSFYPVYRGIYGDGNRWIRGIRYVRATLAMLRTAAVTGERICHYQVFNDLIPELTAISLMKLFGKKVVLTVHDVNSLAETGALKKRLTGMAYRLADRIIVHNGPSRKELEGLGVPSARTSVIPHGHYLDTMGKIPSPSQARRALGIDDSAKVVLFFGQIKDAKGLDLLIEALPEVARAIPDVVLLIAGRPWRTEFAGYDALIDRLGVRGRCKLHIGFVPDKQVADYYSAADVIALPYRRIYQSGVLIMAMTYERPVVVSDLPGMTEIVTDGVNGYVFKEGLSEDLAGVLVRVLRDESGRARIARRAYELVRDNHDWAKIGARTREVYRALLSKNSAQ
jgi:glycosyltransferase involved in cell wall biosynthesis